MDKGGACAKALQWEGAQGVARKQKITVSGVWRVKGKEFGAKEAVG